MQLRGGKVYLLFSTMTLSTRVTVSSSEESCVGKTCWGKHSVPDSLPGFLGRVCDREVLLRLFSFNRGQRVHGGDT